MCLHHSPGFFLTPPRETTFVTRSPYHATDFQELWRNSALRTWRLGKTSVPFLWRQGVDAGLLADLRQSAS